MKLSKNLGRIATTFLATAMLAAFAAVPASADTLTSGVAGSGNGESVITSLDFKSNLKLPSNVSVPNATFTYTLTGATVADGGENVPIGATGKNVEVKPGTGTITGTISDTAEFSSEDVSSGNGDVHNVEESVSIPLTTAPTEGSVLSFSEVGVYKYKLTQSLASASSVDFKLTAKTDRLVYLYVARIGSEYKVTGVVMVDDTTYSSTKSSGVFTNYYLLEGDPDNPDDKPTVVQNNLTVTNTVSGAMGDKSEPFTFNISIENSADANKKYSYIVTKTTGDQPTQTMGVGDANKISGLELTNGESITIYGLTTADTFTVTQTDAGRDGYTTKIDGTENSTITATLTAGSDGKLQSKTVAFTNERNAIAPTGLVMNVAPYVLLVLVAAGAGYVFLRKREED